MSSRRIDTGIYVDAEAREMRRRDEEMIPKGLLYAMIALAMGALLLATYSSLSGRPLAGAPHPAPVVAEATFSIEADGTHVVLTRPDGSPMLESDQGGFMAVVADALERKRLLHAVSGNPPVTVSRLANGRLVLHDPSTNWSAELTSYAAAKVGVWEVLFEE